MINSTCIYDWDILIQFILSIKWIWIIVVALSYNLIKDIINNISKFIIIKSDIVIRDTKYNEEEIISHLDYIIKEVLDEYNVLHIAPKQVFYINSKLEKEIINYVSDEVPKRLSNVLLTHLSFIYNKDYIGTFIGMRIYMTILDWVLEYNLQQEPINMQLQDNKST